LCIFLGEDIMPVDASISLLACQLTSTPSVDDKLPFANDQPSEKGPILHW